MKIFEFVNDNDLDCGQAAAATLLAHYGAVPAKQDALAGIEEMFPPDILFGYLGTGPGRVRDCLDFHFPIEVIHGPEELVDALRKGKPAVIMIQYGTWGGHWVVATEIIGEFIHLTNHGDMRLTEFWPRWNGWLPRLAGFNQRGYVHAGN